MSRWVQAWEWCLRQKDCPILIKSYAQKKASRILNKRAKPATRPPIRFPKGKDPKVEKKQLHAECEALCKAIVFNRDCGGWDKREGNCITCGKFTTLQWGHFIPRQRAPALLYSVQATAGQCAMPCNGPPGHGMPLEFADAIDKRAGAGAAAILRSYERKPHTWNRPKLIEHKLILMKLCKQAGIDVGAVLAKLNNKGETE